MRDGVVSIKNSVLNTQPLKWLVQLHPHWHWKHRWTWKPWRLLIKHAATAMTDLFEVTGQAPDTNLSWDASHPHKLGQRESQCHWQLGCSLAGFLPYSQVQFEGESFCWNSCYKIACIEFEGRVWTFNELTPPCFYPVPLSFVRLYHKLYCGNEVGKSVPLKWRRNGIPHPS